MKELPFTDRGGRAFELSPFFSVKGAGCPGSWSRAYEELDSRQTDRQTDGEGETRIASVRGETLDSGRRSGRSIRRL